MFGGEDTPQQGCKVVVVNFRRQPPTSSRTDDAVGRSIQDLLGRVSTSEIVGVVAQLAGVERVRRESRPTISYYAPSRTLLPSRSERGALLRVPERAEAVLCGVLEASVVSQSYLSDGLCHRLPVSFLPTILRRRTRRVWSDQPAGLPTAQLNGGCRWVGAAVIDGGGRIPRTRIVGVVQAPVLRTSQRRAGAGAIYLPMAQDLQPRMTLLLNARASDERTLTAVQPCTLDLSCPAVSFVERR